VVDVRDVAAAVLRAIELDRAGGRYLLVGANLRYTEVLYSIARHAHRRCLVFPVPSGLMVLAGAALERAGDVSGRPPLLTRSYGLLSGWRCWYSGERGRRELGLEYTPFARTVKDGCRYFERVILGRPEPARHGFS